MEAEGPLNVVADRNTVNLNGGGEQSLLQNWRQIKKKKEKSLENRAQFWDRQSINRLIEQNWQNLIVFFFVHIARQNKNTCSNIFRCVSTILVAAIFWVLNKNIK